MGMINAKSRVATAEGKILKRSDGNHLCFTGWPNIGIDRPDGHNETIRHQQVAERQLRMAQAGNTIASLIAVD